ncbi:DUF2058 family protein [bacterium]|nr:DUF2058 family protein [candidate division CSSED10-310 bacterium]
MGDLKDQLLKAGLIDKTQARDVRREQRRERQEKGVRALENAAREKEAEFRNLREMEARQERERARRQREVEEADERVAQLDQVIENGRVFRDVSGSVKFYFIARSGVIPCLEVSSGAADALRNGTLAIVEKPSSTGKQFVLVNRESALRIKQDAPERIRFFQAG